VLYIDVIGSTSMGRLKTYAQVARERVCDENGYYKLNRRFSQSPKKKVIKVITLGADQNWTVVDCIRV